MGFLGPWFLGGLVALGLPVYIHLLRRHITTPRPFSSLMFFERGTQSSTRHRRLRYLLLFASRMALLFLLILAFANPFIRRANMGASGRLLLVVVDNSFSMRAGTRFADAKRGALELLAAKPSSQRAQVIAFGHEPQVLTQPIQDLGGLRSALQSIQPSDSYGSFGELGRGIRAIAESTSAPIELHLFSDMQKTDMPANFADMVLPPQVSLVLHPAVKSSATPPPNWTVESIEAPAQLPDPKDLKRSHVQAVIAGYGTPAATRTVSLVVNGKVTATRSVEVPANGRVSVQFQPIDVPYGFSRCEIKIDAADGFAADDAGVFAVQRSDPERVLLVHPSGDARSALYFADALGAAAESSFVVQTINAEQTADVDPAKYAFVVLSDAMSLPSIFENSLVQYVRAGGNVLVAAGTSAAHRARIPVFGENVLDAHDYSRNGGFAKVGQIDSTYPAMSETTDAAAGSGDSNGEAAKETTGWSDLKFYYAIVVDPAHSRVVARLTDGTPLLLDKQIGEGHVLLLTSGMDNLTNDLPLHPVFVPFVDHAARYLSGGGRLSGSRLVDSFVQLRTAAASPGNQSMNVDVIDPDGHRPLSLSEARSIQSFQLTRAGFYQVRFSNGRDAVLGVNPDRRESDLAPIPEDVLQLWSGAAGPSSQVSAQPADTASAERKKPADGIWWYIMVLALIAAVAESIVASGYLGTQREEA